MAGLIYHDGMLEDTNSLDGAHLYSFVFFIMLFYWLGTLFGFNFIVMEIDAWLRISAQIYRS